MIADRNREMRGASYNRDVIVMFQRVSDKKATARARRR